MSDFRTKLLGLAAVATLFAGASYGQGITACTTTGAGLGVTPGPTNMRAEGTNELAGDLNFTCTNTLTSTTATVTTFASAPVTSQALSSAALSAANAAIPGSGPAGGTEAALFICLATACTPGAAGATGGPYYGTISGNQITFSSVTIPAANFFGIVKNVRLNASAVTIGATLTTATEQVLASANNTSAATLATTTGFVFKSLAAPGLIATPNGGNTPAITPYTNCTGNPLPTTGNLSRLSFGVSVAETFGGAFKATNAPAPGNGGAAPFGEGGSFVPSGTAGTAGYAISGTKIQLVFSNVAGAETIYVPSSITNTANGTLVLTLVSSATSVDPIVPVAASTTTGAPAGATTVTSPFTATWPGESYGASAALTASNGTATAVYEVSASDNAFIQSAVVPVFVTFAANAFTTAPATITVLESYAPTAAASAATTVPNFAPPTNSPLPATAITLCQTSLLFPFVTNQLGFDTGIALANTSTDPFGTVPAPGTCTLNFYGAGAPTPSTGVAAPGGTQASGTTNAFLLSSVAAGFQGYVIAQCNYQFGHGFAFIAQNLGQPAGSTMGYLALELERAGLGSETLGQ
jgi:hypothetical protein